MKPCLDCRIRLVLLVVILSMAFLSFQDCKRQSYNILFIIVDDLRPELGCYGATHIRSPNIDRLAGESLVFERAYCQAPICSPSRMSFLTGLRPTETGINKNDYALRNELPDIVTLPQHFRKHGYQAEAHGKVFHQGVGDSLSWDHYDDSPPQRTYHLKINTSINVIGDKSRRGRPFEDADVADSLYTEGIVAGRALRALECFDPDRPFFLAEGFLKPHLPFNAPKRYWVLYDEPGKYYKRILERPEGHPAYAFMNSAELRNYQGVPKSGPIPGSKQDSLVHGYYACISYMDAQVGNMLAKLEDLGYTDNTIVVLFGDHGYKLGDFDDWCKNTHYELDTHVPLIIHHPDKKGGRTASITELIDLYPTLVEATGTSPAPHRLPGKDLMPLFDAPDQRIGYRAFTERPRKDVYGYSIRTDSFRLVKWVDINNPERVDFLELYKYSGQQMEIRNLAHDDEHRNKLEELRSFIKQEFEGD